MITFGFTFLISYQLCLTASACARAEYEVNGECCPMCAPGNHVYWHCTIDTSTTCIPCPPSTYTDEPNGLNKCILCRVCNAGQGLRVKRSCTRSADTVCEPLEGFYCTDQNKGSCRFAVKHSECHPGQYIKQTGEQHLLILIVVTVQKALSLMVLLLPVNHIQNVRLRDLQKKTQEQSHLMLNV